MQNKNVIETIMGAVVLVVAAGFVVFAYEGSQMRVEKGYNIKAKFANATGVALGSDVKIGGIKIGVISDLSLDPITYDAVATVTIRQGTEIPTDSTAAITSNGLLGEKFIQIVPGGDEKMIAEDGVIKHTQSSVSLEELIGKFMFSGGGVNSGQANNAGGSTANHP